ncbi:MAG: hypothetical protein JW730_16320 [Anaerolineales bacterium]|nr:hypothetical protein [Anaerolineales bacterium]
MSPSEQTTTQTILLTTGSAGAAASTTTTSGILWGAAAAAAIAAATTYALDVTQKRKQAEEAQAERVRAQVAHDKAEWAEKHLTREEKAQRAEQHDQKVKERKEQQSWANPAKEKALLKEQEERDRAYQEQLQQEKLRQQLANQRVAMKLTKFEVQQEVQRRAEQEALKKQREQAAANARTEKKMAQLETLDAGWVAAQAAAKKKQEEEQESPGKLASLWEKAKSFVKEKIIEPVNEKIIQPYIKPHVENEIEKAKNAISWVDEKVVQPYVKPYVEKQIEKAKNTIEVVNEKVVQPYIVPAVTAVQEKSWWQKTWEEVKDAREKAILWVDQHQTEIALGIGVAVGIAAIVLSGGTATPLVAAWVAGAAAVAAGAIAIETVALNVHYGREWHENLGRNIAISALSAAAVAGAWFIFQAATTAAGPFCYAHQAICGRIEPVLNTLDWGEEAWLTTKMAFQTWTGNQAAAAETALELQMERMDGGMPGNSIAKELGEETLEKVAKYGDEALSLVMLYGDDAAEIIAKYGDDGVAVLQKYGDDAVDLITRYKDDTFDFVKRAEKLGVNPTDILDNPPLPGQTLEGWLLKIDDPRNPVNLPSTLDLSDAKIRELWEGAINNPESDEYVIGYFGGDNVIPYNKLANDRNATFFSMEESVYRDTGFKKDTGDFWNVNREAIMYGVDERKTFVLNVKLDRVLSNPEKTTYAEVQLILHPGNNYVVIEGDEYDMLVPAELLNP